MRAHRSAYLESLKSVLGAPPDPVPLRSEVLNTDFLKTYVRDKVRFQVSPGDWSYAYVLKPLTGQRPFPIVICHHRHNQDWDIGKSEIVGLKGDSDEAIGVELVERGYMVIAPDAIAFEDRRPTQEDGSLNNFRELSVRLLRGETLLRKVIWDIQKAIDYIYTRDDVDLNRVGFLGHGYGAKMAIWSLAFDDRIQIAAAHGGISSMHQTIKLGHTIPYEFAVPRLLQVVDYDRVLSLAAPRPFLLSTTNIDPDSTDADEVFRKASRVYEQAGAGNRLLHYHYLYGGLDEPWFTKQARDKIYSWFNSWMMPY